MGATTRAYEPGEKLFGEGEPSTSIFIIKDGIVAVRKKKNAGFVEIAKLRSNEVLGELSFFDRLPRSATAVAVTKVTAIEIDFASLDNIYSAVPPYFKTIMAAVASRLRKANETIKRLESDVMKPEDLDKLDSTTEAGGAEVGDVEKLLAGDSGENK